MGWGPSAPDMTAANTAATSQAASAASAAQIAQEQWNDYKTQFAPVILRQMQDQIDMGRSAQDMDRQQQDFQMGLARKYDQRYWGTQVPLEDEIIKQAREFNTEGYREKQAGLALGDVNRQFANSREEGARYLSRAGVNPADGRYADMSRQMDRDQALAGATAMNKTREAARQMGWARNLDAAALGRGLPGFSSNASQLAQSWGVAGQGAGGAGMAAAVGASGAGNQAAYGAGGLYSQAGNIYGNASANYRNNAIESSRNPGFDAIMGLAAGGLRLAGSTYGGAGWGR